MKKGLVMEIAESYAIVLSDNGEMDKIEIKPGMKVGQKLFYFDDDIVQASSNNSNSNSNSYNFSKFFKSFGTIAAAIVFMFTMFYKLNIDKTYVVVSLDINPSIQISADVNKKIIKVQGMNEDGRNIDFSKIKGEKLNDGIEDIKNILVEKKYLETNKDVLVAVAIYDDNSDDSYQENIMESVNSSFSDQNIAYVKVEQKEDVVKAEEEGISLGRYEASKLSSNTSTSEAKDAPVKEITEKIKDNEKVIYYDKTEKQEEKSNSIENIGSAEDNSDNIRKEIDESNKKNEDTSSNIVDKSNKSEKQPEVKKEEDKPIINQVPSTSSIEDNSEKPKIEQPEKTPEEKNSINVQPEKSSEENKPIEEVKDKKQEVDIPKENKLPAESSN